MLKDPQEQKVYAIDQFVRACGELIRVLMKQDNVSVEELARKLGIKRQTVEKTLSRGNMNLRTFCEYLYALGYVPNIDVGEEYNDVREKDCR